MGKGDKKTRRGKIVIKSYGVRRPQRTVKKANAEVVAEKKAKRQAKAVTKEDTVPMVKDNETSEPKAKRVRKAAEPTAEKKTTKKESSTETAKPKKTTKKTDESQPDLFVDENK